MAAIFGQMPDGSPVYCSVIKGGGVTAEILTYGATVHRLLVPDRDGKIADIILGKKDLSGYMDSGAPAAAVIGRIGNRIKDHSFSLDGNQFTLEANEQGTVTLHSASGNYARKNFALVDETEHQVRLTVRDKGEAGFPGEMTVEVCYSLDDDGKLLIEYTGIPTVDTPFNPTNHVYFNLAGHDSGVIDNQRLQIDADFYTPTDSLDIPTGEILKTGETPFDFTKSVPFKDAMKALADFGDKHGGVDHNFVLNGTGWRKVAEAYDEQSGRAMDVLTDLPGVQLYTSNLLAPGTVGKDGAVYNPHWGFCLETQFFPDFVHKPHFPAYIAVAGETFVTSTAYKFYVK